MPTTLSPDFTATTRECPHPDHVGDRVLPFTGDNFYTRPNGSADYWCRECVRRYNRQQRSARAAGRGRRVTRKFGIEIEFIGDRYAVARELEARGVAVHNSGYTHRVMRQWKIVTDASVNNGYELVSPPMKGAAGIEQLRLACEALAAAGATTNRSCGLHVHHDVSDLAPAAFGRLFRAWSNNQRNTDGLLAASRRNSQWARPLRIEEVQHAEALTSTDRHAAANHFRYADRYRSLNVAAFGRYGTVEVRQHQGTINFDKIAAWVAFGQAFIAWAKSDQPVDSELTTDALVDRLAQHGLGADQATYLKSRAAHFAGRPVAA